MPTSLGRLRNGRHASYLLFFPPFLFSSTRASLPTLISLHPPASRLQASRQPSEAGHNKLPCQHRASTMLFVNSFAVVVAYALVLARIVSSTGEKPTTCTTDGCLIAFEANARPASTFCAAYTNPHTAVGSPAATRSAQLYKHRRQASALDPYYTSFIPSTCQPSDLSSACTCHATYTAPPSAVATCSKGQVIVNPSFDGLPPTYAPDISPWTITHVYGDGGCALNLGNPLEAATDQYYKDDRSM